MKKLFTLILTLIVSVSVFAQIPGLNSGGPSYNSSIKDVLIGYNMESSLAATSRAQFISAEGPVFLANATVLTSNGIDPGAYGPTSCVSIGQRSTNWFKNNLSSYYEFTVNPDPLSTIAYTDLQVSFERNTNQAVRDFFLEVKVGAGAWTQISPVYSVASNSDQNCYTINFPLQGGSSPLNAPIAGPVTVSFRFYGTNSQNSSPQGMITIGNIQVLYEIAGSFNTLPVQLTSFSGKREANTVVLNWETAMEQNNEFFLIERSLNGSEFQTIGRVAGAGNSTSVLNYEFVDNAPVSGNAYYRLKQVDFDGAFEYSKIITIAGAKQVFSFNLFPNPVVADVNMNLYSESASGVTLEIVDVTGRVLRSENTKVAKGDNSISLSVSDLNKGIYFIKVSNGDNVKVERFVKQ